MWYKNKKGYTVLLVKVTRISYLDLNIANWTNIIYLLIFENKTKFIFQV